MATDKIQSALRSRLLHASLLLSLLYSPALGNLIVTPGNPPITIVGTQFHENVSFGVFNQSLTYLVLDYALEIISPAPDPGAALVNEGLGFPGAYTVIPQGTTGFYVFTVNNPFGDPTPACCFDGVNNITLYVELSPLSVAPTSYTTMTTASGVLVLPVGGASTLSGTNASTMTALTNCLNNPGAFPNPCPAATSDYLYGNSSNPPQRGTAVQVVNLVGVPEPATLWTVGIGCAFVALSKIRSHKANRGY